MAQQPPPSVPAIAPTSAPEDDKFPANHREDKYVLAPPLDDFEEFLKQDLSVQRLEDIKQYLWIVGLPYRPRPLNVQAVLNRSIIPTTDACLHLVWTSTRIFIKPLPRYMLSDEFYGKYLSKPKPDQKAPEHLRPTLGFLYSYLALVPSELDFMLAREAHLIPLDYKWSDWRALTRRVLKDYPGREVEVYVAEPQKPGRYTYGELRLSRLNKIYRVLHGDLLHGYSPLTGHTRYVDFLTENLGTIAAGTIYMVVVLTAMQVALSTKVLEESATFQSVCYGFAVFSILSPLLALSMLLLVFVFMFVVNAGSTLIVRRKHRKESEREKERKSGG